MKSDLVNVEVVIISDDPRKAAICVNDGSEIKDVRGQVVGPRWIWLPRSQIEVEMKPDGKHATVTMPEWLAIEKKLV